jgi:hypothetical protein
MSTERLNTWKNFLQNKKSFVKFGKWSAVVLSIFLFGFLFVNYVIPVLAATTTSNNNAPAQTIATDETDFLVMDFNLIVGSDSVLGGQTPTGGTATVDDIDGDWTTIHYYDAVGGGTWNAAADWLGTDDDNDNVYTSAVDTVIDCDGTATATAGACAAHSAGDALTAVETADKLCTNSATTPTIVFIDNNGACVYNLADDAANILLGVPVEANDYGDPINGQGWAFVDGGGGAFGQGEDLYLENVAGSLTYSAAADTPIAGANPSAGTVITSAAGASPAAWKLDSIDAAPGGAWNAAADSILIDADDNDYYLDKLTAITADLHADSTINALEDTTSIEFWLDAGAAGFQGEGVDTLLGTAETDTAYDSGGSGWYISGLSQALLAGTNRIFVSMTLNGTASDGEKVKVNVPTKSDSGEDKTFALGDTGIFLSSRVLGNVVNTNSMTVDAVLPTLDSVSIESDNINPTYAKVNDTVTITFVSSESIQTPTVNIDGNAADDITNTGGNTWTATRQMQTGDTEAVIGFTIDFTDLAGNDGIQVSATTDLSSVTFDETQPTVLIVDSDGDTYNTGTVSPHTITVTFLEDVSQPTIFVDLDAQTVTDCGDAFATTWCFDYTVPPITETSPTTIIITEAADLAGNTMDPDATHTFAVDTVLPTVLIVDSDGLTYNAASLDPTVTVTFSEDVSIPTISVGPDGGAQAVDDCSDEDETTWCFTYSLPSVDLTEETITINGAADLSANVMDEDATHTFDVDTVLPTVAAVNVNDASLSDADAGAGNFIVTVDFSETMGATAPTITFSPDVVDSGTLTNCGGVWTDGNTYTYTCDVVDVGETQTDVDIQVSDAQDVAGNTMDADLLSGADKFAVDTENPTVTSITPNLLTIAEADAGAGTFTVAVVYSEAMDGGSPPTITFSPDVEDSGTLALSSGSWTDVGTYTVVYDVADVDETQTVDINVVDATDVVGNTQQTGSSTTAFSVDTVRPTVDTVSSDGATYYEGTSSPVTITVTFLEDVSQPTILVGADEQTVTDCGDADATTWCFDYTVPAPTDATETITISAAADLAGNVMDEDATHNFDVDTVKPEISGLNVNDNLLTDGDQGAGNFILTLDFSETMDTGTAPTITFSPDVGTTLINCIGDWTNGDTYVDTCEVADANVAVPSVDIQVSGATDVVGNTMEDDLVTGAGAFIIDTENPTVTFIVPSLLTIAESGVGTGTFSVAIVYSEAMDPFSTPTITFSPDVEASGTLTLNAGLSGWTDGNTYTAVYDVADVNETQTVDINVVGATDFVGNTQQAGLSSAAFSVDMVPPEMTIIYPTLNAITGTAFTAEVTTDENANCRYNLDLDAAYGDMTGFTSTDTTTHTLDLTGLSGGTHRIYVRCQDTAGNDVVDAETVSWTVDTSLPTLSQPLVNSALNPIVNSNPTISNVVAVSPLSLLIDANFYIDSTSGEGTSCAAGDGTFDENSEQIVCTLTSDQWDALSEGQHYIFIDASNANGVSAFAIAAFYKDTLPPLIEIMDPWDGTTVGSTNPSISFTILDNARINSNSIAITLDDGETSTPLAFNPLRDPETGNGCMVGSISDVGISSVNGAPYPVGHVLLCDYRLNNSETLIDGDTYTMTISVSDYAGNSGVLLLGPPPLTTSSPAEIIFTVDTTRVINASLIASDTNGVADGTYANGWSFTFNISTGTGGNAVRFRMDDWQDSYGHHFPVFNYTKMVYYANDTGTQKVYWVNNTYDETQPLYPLQDVDSGTDGTQGNITVYVSIPIGTTAGSYSTSYGVGLYNLGGPE